MNNKQLNWYIVSLYGRLIIDLIEYKLTHPRLADGAGQALIPSLIIREGQSAKWWLGGIETQIQNSSSNLNIKRNES